MRYCERCQRLLPDNPEVCDACGKTPRFPRENDPVLLVACGFLHATMIEPLLADTGMPFSKIGDLGVGFTMRAGNLMETYRFYVPYGAYAHARALLESAFGEDPAIMDELE